MTLESDVPSRSPRDRVVYFRSHIIREFESTAHPRAVIRDNTAGLSCGIHTVIGRLGRGCSGILCRFGAIVNDAGDAWLWLSAEQDRSDRGRDPFKVPARDDVGSLARTTRGGVVDRLGRNGPRGSSLALAAAQGHAPRHHHRGRIDVLLRRGLHRLHGGGAIGKSVDDHAPIRIGRRFNGSVLRRAALRLLFPACRLIQSRSVVGHQTHLKRPVTLALPFQMQLVYREQPAGAT